MTRFLSPLLIVLLFAAYSTAYAQTETASDGAAAAPKYGPVYQLEIKDQASGEGFRGMKVVKKFARRLPNFYGQVVFDEQKSTIYDIQSAYFEPVEMLTLRLDRLKVERDAQIEAVLTAEQKKKVEALNKDSLARRAANRTANAN
jgi:hypothetical protein